MHHGAVGNVFVANARWALQEILAAGSVDGWLPPDALKNACGRKTLAGDTWGATLQKIQLLAPFNLIANASYGQPIKDSSANGFAKPRQA